MIIIPFFIVWALMMLKSEPRPAARFAAPSPEVPPAITPAEPTARVSAAPKGPVIIVLQQGDRGPGGGTWLATSEADYDPMMEAEAAIKNPNRGPGAGAARSRLYDEGRIRFYGNGEHVKILKSAPGRRFVEIISGESKGHTGWVSSNYLEEIPAPTVTTSPFILSGRPEDGAVWIATKEEDYDPMYNAIDELSRATPPVENSILSKLQDSGRIQYHENGTHVQILKASGEKRFVQIIDGQKIGRTGWVRAQFIKEAPSTSPADKSAPPISP